MAEQKYDEQGYPVRSFPLTLVRDDQTRTAHTEGDVVAAQWDGFVLQGEMKSLDKAQEKAAKERGDK